MVKKIVLIGLIAIALTSWITFGISAFAPQPAAAEPRCEQWDVSQGWVVKQENGYLITLNLTQTGTKLSGSALLITPAEDGIMGAFGGVSRYPVNGSLIGNSIKLEPGWGGVYIGTIDDTGRIDGTTYDKKDSTSSAKWFSDRRMECLATAGTQETQSEGKPGLKLGRVQKPKALGKVTLPPKLVSVKLTPSTIRASGSSTAIVTLDEVAPPRGITVFLASSDPERVSIPGSIIVPAGQKSGSVVLRADNKLFDGQVQITASLQSGAFQADAIAKSTVMATLTIQNLAIPSSPTSTKRAIGKVQIEQPDPPICANARSARARNSPAAPGLEAQCRAAGGKP